MNIKQLTYFIEIAKRKSFTKAANELYISQSALSKTVKMLESQLGVQLIDRASKTFKLTDEGQILFEKGQLVLDKLNDELDMLYDSLSLKQGKLSVGIPPVIGTAYFTSIIYQFRNLYPHIELTIAEAGANTIKEKVDKGELDIGVVILPFVSDHFQIIPIISNENVLLVNKDHPLAQYDEVSFKMLKDEKFISLDSTFMLHDKIRVLCNMAGFEPDIVCESSQWDFVADMVAVNQGVAILPKPILKKFRTDNIKLIKLVEPEFPWDIAIIMRKDKYRSNAINLFIDLSKEEGEKI